MQNKPPPADQPDPNPFESPETVSPRTPMKPIALPGVLAQAGIVMAVIVSSTIAFCCTCIPVGVFAFELHPRRNQEGQRGIDWHVVCQFLPFIAGLIVAILVGYWVRRSLWNRWKQS